MQMVGHFTGGVPSWGPPEMVSCTVNLYGFLDTKLFGALNLNECALLIFLIPNCSLSCSTEG